MAAEWRTLSLREANVSLIDCEHRTPPAASGGYPYIAIPQIRHGRVDLSGVRRISDEHFIEWTRKAAPQPFDVVLSRRCNPGETAFIPPELECAIGQNLVLLRADGTRIYPPFLRWLVRGTEWWEQVGAFINVGAVFDSLKCPNFQMPVPPFAEQRRIADILGALDDKIELNWRMSETLEPMARALFKSWFVDFDPVRAKADRRDSGLPRGMANMFPNRLEQSELGPVPTGWRTAMWGDLVSLEYGKSLSGYHGQTRTYPVYGTNGRIGSHSEPLCRHPGVIVGRKGAYRGVHYSTEPFFVIDTAFYVETKASIELRWVYYELLRRDINSMDSGSAIPSTSREEFYRMPVVVPSLGVQRAFVQFLEPCWDRQTRNQKESDILGFLRDALLPRLLSGELRVTEAERLIGKRV